MKKTALQIRDKCPFCDNRYRHLVGFDKESDHKLAAFKEFQPIESTLKGSEKPRSMIQLGLYWSCCRRVASNSKKEETDKSIDFKTKVKFSKEYPEFIKRFQVEEDDDGNRQTFLELPSVSLENADHLEACNYINIALEIMAGFIGVTKEQLIAARNDT